MRASESSTSVAIELQQVQTGAEHPCNLLEIPSLLQSESGSIQGYAESAN